MRLGSWSQVAEFTSFGGLALITVHVKSGPGELTRVQTEVLSTAACDHIPSVGSHGTEHHLASLIIYLLSSVSLL